MVKKHQTSCYSYNEYENEKITEKQLFYFISIILLSYKSLFVCKVTKMVRKKSIRINKIALSYLQIEKIKKLIHECYKKNKKRDMK